MDRPLDVIPDLVRALRGETVRPAPIWFMRQAGRYLPEYRQLRTRSKSFLDFCYSPDLAVEATLQPMRRYDFDASIIFSDILVIPHALGQDVWFVEGEGPRLAPLTDATRLAFDRFDDMLAPVYEAVRRLRAALPREKAVIGFCGAPWTLATYMVAGRGGEEKSVATAFAAAEPAAFAALVDVLVEACTRHLVRQIEAGADAVQIFDSWAGALDADGLARWSIAPTRRIVDGVRAAASGIPIIGFPRNADAGYAAFVAGTGVDGVSLDQRVSLDAARALQDHVCVQGNLDPALLVAGGPALDDAVARICAALGDGPFVFNLGHGITPDAAPENVAHVIAAVKRLTS